VFTFCDYRYQGSVHNQSTYLIMEKQLVTSARRATPHAGSGMLLTILNRYVKNAGNRTRREIALARAIDAHPGAKEKLTDFISRWDQLPQEKKISIVGRPYAALDVNAAFSEENFIQEFKRVFPANLVDVGHGVSVRRETVQEFEIGSVPFKLPVIDVPVITGRLPDRKILSGEKVRSVNKQAGPVIGNAPVMQPMNAQVPLYQVEFAGVYCQKESPWDGGSNSDEMYSCFSMFLEPDANNWGRRSAIYDDMDSGDDWKEDPNPCILYGPAPAPQGTLWINTLMCESDFGNADEINKMWHDAATVATCVAKYVYGIEVKAEVANAAANLLNWIFGLGDDMMSSDSIMIHPEAFEWYANQPLTHFKVQLHYHMLTLHTGNGAKYYSFYRIRRL
jgi:hypothetical protein